MSWGRVRERGPRRLGRTLLPFLSQLPVLGTEPSTGNNHLLPSGKVGPATVPNTLRNYCREDGQQPIEVQVLARDESCGLQGEGSFMVNRDSWRAIVTSGKAI